MTLFKKAERLLYDFKKDSYIHGPGVLDRIGGDCIRDKQQSCPLPWDIPGK